MSDGYDFMRCLAVHLRYKALHKPEQGHIYFSQQATGRRKPMKSSSSGLPGWHLRSLHHRESVSSLERHAVGEMTKAVQPHTDQPTKEP